MLNSQELQRLEASRSCVSYHPHHAYACAVASWLAYHEGTELATHCDHLGLTIFDELDGRAPHFCIVIGGAGFRILAFRGMDRVKGGQRSTRMIPKKTQWGCVRQGVQLAVDSFWPEISKHAHEAADRHDQLWITGHGFGGAMAMLAGARLGAEDGTTIHSIYTYDSLPAGYRRFNRWFHHAFTDRYVRFVNPADARLQFVLGGVAAPLGQLRYVDPCGAFHPGPPRPRHLKEFATDFGRRLAALILLGCEDVAPGVPEIPTPTPRDVMEHYVALTDRHLKQQNRSLELDVSR